MRKKDSPIIFENIRGKLRNYEVKIENEKLNTTMWTPVLYAIANPNKIVDLVKYMVEKVGMHTGICIKEPFYDSEKDGIIING